LSYVLRYANLTSEAQQECDLAMKLDSGNYQFRSCSGVFMNTGKFARARDFVLLDQGSEWSNNAEIMLLMREGKISEAMEKSRPLPDSPFFHTRAIEACYSNPKPAGADQLLQETSRVMFAYHDPEPKFSQAASFNACMGNDFTARLLKSAMDGGFCGYDYLQLDPLLANFRRTSPQYPALLAQGKQCRDRFLAERDKPLQ